MSYLVGAISTAQANDFIVTRVDDRNAACAAGNCSLREAIKATNSAEESDSIAFDISFTSCEPLTGFVLSTFRVRTARL